MIAGNSENIALVIETQSKLEGLLAARMGVKDLGNQVQATAEQSRKAWAASGGDMSRFAVELAKLTAVENQQAAAVVKVTAAEHQRALALRLASTEIDKMSPRVRTAANAATTLTFAMQGAGGSAQSMAIAAGTLTTSLASLASTAKVAAAATGIGAIVVVLATVIGFFTKASAEAKKAGEEFEKSLNALARASDATGILGKIREIYEGTGGLTQLQERLAAATAKSASTRNVFDKMQAEGTIRKLTPQVAAMTAEVTKLQTALNDLPTKRLDIDRTIRVGSGEVGKVAGEAYGAAFSAAYRAAMSDFGAYQAGAGSRVGTLATEKAGGNLGMNLPADIMAPIPITPINAAGDAVLTLKDRFDLLRTSVVFAGEAMKDAALGAVESYTRGGESALKALKRLALEPIVKKLEGLAASEAVEALVAAAHLNLPKAALHVAGAAAAAVAARKVASLGGLSSGASGGGGYGGSGGGNVGTFRPSYGGGSSGGQTVNIIVRDAAGRDQVAETIHNLNRARSLNVSGLPPTRGVDVRVA